MRHPSSRIALACTVVLAAAAERGADAMIGRLAGTLLEKNPPQILLDVQGVAYEVDVPMSTF